MLHRKLFLLLLLVGFCGLASQAQITEYHNSTSGQYGLKIKSSSSGASFLNLENASGFWHLSAPRTTESYDPFAIMYYNGNEYFNYFTIRNNGNVGVGSTYLFPNSLFHVADESALKAGETKNLLEITHHTDINNIGARFGIRFSSPISSGVLKKGTAIYNVSEDVYMNKNGLAFHVSNNHNNEPVERMRLDSRGYLGIGTTNPRYKLDVNGIGGFFDGANLDIALTTPGGENGVVFNGSEYSGYSRFNIWNHKNTTQSARYLELRYNSDNSGLAIRKGGNVGIGTTAPDYKLSVNGTIGAKEVKVTSSGWPDFVFESDYILPTLQEVENYIDQNGHLPDIPSAEEVKADGISLGEMNAKLLQKIEELTLYSIHQESEINKLYNEVDQLKEMISDILNSK